MKPALVTAALACVLGLASCTSEKNPPPDPTNETGSPAGGARSEAVWLEDVTDRAGLDLIQTSGDAQGDYIIDTVGTGAAWLDYDGDGDPDLYIAQGATRAKATDGPPDRLFRNDGDDDGDGVPSFTDVTEAAGLGDRLWSFAVAVGDVDNDGDPDLYLMNWGANRLYLNQGDGTFVDVAPTAGVDNPRWGAGGGFSDIDHDGDLDLFVTNYVEFDFDRYPARGQPGKAGEPPCVWRDVQVLCGPRNLEPSPDVLYRNDGDPGDGIPRFTDVTRESGLETPVASYGLAMLFFDADNDGDDDLYVANDSLMNAFFVNDGTGRFEEIALLAGLAYNEQGHEQAGMGVTTADFDGDGWFDLAVTNFSHDHDTLYRNEGRETFTDVSYPAGLGSPSYFTLAWGITFVDLDQDTWEDLYVSHGHVYPQVDERDLGTTFRQPNSVFRNLGNGRFEETTGESGPGLATTKSSRSVLPADVDGDGDLDLLISNLNDRPDLLLNTGAPGNWLQVRLEGTESNREGIGALVKVHAGGRVQARQINRTASFAGATVPIAHFGLGDADEVERIEVRWPSGRASRLDAVEANRLVRIREDDTP